MFINVVIPTCPFHIKYIQTAIDSVYNQSLKADRIVCVLNEFKRYEEDYKKIIDNNKDVVFIKYDGWNVAGANRRLGTKYILERTNEKSMDSSIICYHDVDDIMLPNKLEHVSALFDKYRCDLLLHEIEYDWEKKEWKDINVNKVNVIYSNTINKRLKEYTKNLDITNHSINKYNPEYNVRWNLIFGKKYKKTKSSRIHHGLASVKTSIFKSGNLYWTDKTTGQDVLFVNEVNRQLSNSLIVLHPYCKIVGKDHVRRYGNKIYKHKRSKQVKYKLDKDDNFRDNIKHEGFDFDFTKYLKKKVII